jgi:hypothetical protein
MPRSKFFRAALHDEPGNYSALVISPKNEYVQEVVRHESLYNALIMFGNGHTIDFMTIDVEGAEFSLLKTLHGNI